MLEATGILWIVRKFKFFNFLIENKPTDRNQVQDQQGQEDGKGDQNQGQYGLNQDQYRQNQMDRGEGKNEEGHGNNRQDLITEGGQDDDQRQTEIGFQQGQQESTDNQGANISSQNIASAVEPTDRLQEKREDTSEDQRQTGEQTVDQTKQDRDKTQETRLIEGGQNLPTSPKGAMKPEAGREQQDQRPGDTNISERNEEESREEPAKKGKVKGKKGKPKGTTTSNKGRKPKAAQEEKESRGGRRSTSPRAIKGKRGGSTTDTYPATRDRKKISNDEYEKYSHLLNQKTKRKKTK